MSDSSGKKLFKDTVSGGVGGICLVVSGLSFFFFFFFFFFFCVFVFVFSVFHSLFARPSSGHFEGASADESSWRVQRNSGLCHAHHSQRRAFGPLSRHAGTDRRSHPHVRPLLFRIRSWKADFHH